MRVDGLDAIDIDDDLPVEQSSPSRIIRLGLAHARTELGLLNDTAANRMVVSDCVRKYMKNVGMRPTHISMQFPTVVELYFLRSSRDEELRLMRRSAGYQRYRRTGVGA
jgi:hypothetical protein